MTDQWWFWLGITIVGALILLAALFLKLFPSILSRIVPRRKKPGEKLVALFGDSITEGKMSHNYVDILSDHLECQGYRFMNAGIGGDTAYNLLNRMDPVVKSQPDYVVILVGTNDMQAYLRGGHMTPQNQRMKKLPQAVTLDWYISLLKQMVQSLRTSTQAQIALCSIPIMGENLNSRPNQCIRLFNQSIKGLAEELNVAYLPVHETMGEFLRTHQKQAGLGFDEAKFGRMMLGAAWEHNILGRSWNDISARNQLLLTVDSIHFNRRGAEIMADLIERWVHQQAKWSKPFGSWAADSAERALTVDETHAEPNSRQRAAIVGIQVFAGGRNRTARLHSLAMAVFSAAREVGEPATADVRSSTR